MPVMSKSFATHLERPLRSLLMFVALLCTAQPGIAQATSAAYFTLERSSESASDFVFEGFEALDFASVAPDGFRWTDTPETVEDFEESGAFSALERRYVGGDPVDPGSGIISIYGGRLVTERIGLATDYARLFAGVWGPANLGVDPHDASFGQVLTSDEDGADPAIIRISVFRRAEELLVVRAEAPRSAWPQFGPRVGTFVGSIAFDVPSDPDPYVSTFLRSELAVAPASGRPGTIAVDLPPHWLRLPLENTTAHPGGFAFFVDKANDRGDAATLLYAMQADPFAAVTQGETGEAMAAELLVFFLANMLPEGQHVLSLLNVLTFPDFEDLDFNGYHAFRVELGPDGRRAAAHVLITRTDRQLVGFVTLAPYPTGMAGRGANLNPTLVSNQLQRAVRRYWDAVR